MVKITTAVGDQANQTRRYRSEIWRNNSEAEQTQESRIRRLISSIFPSHVSTHEPQMTTITSVSQIRRNSHTSVSYAPSRRHSNTSILGNEATSRVNPVLRRHQEVKEQAIFFIVAFVCTYMVSYIHRIYEQINGTSPFWLRLIARVLNSLQGFFNILVYTRPHVTSLRRRHKELNWFQAFWAVVKKGGDNDRPNARRNSSLAASRRVSIPAQAHTPRHRQQEQDIALLRNVPIEETKQANSAQLPRSLNNSFLNLSRKSRSSKSNDELGENEMNQILNTVAAMNNKEQCEQALLVSSRSLPSEKNEDIVEKGLVISKSSSPETKDKGSD